MVLVLLLCRDYRACWHGWTSKEGIEGRRAVDRVVTPGPFRSVTGGGLELLPAAGRRSGGAVPKGPCCCWPTTRIPFSIPALVAAAAAGRCGFSPNRPCSPIPRVGWLVRGCRAPSRYTADRTTPRPQRRNVQMFEAVFAGAGLPWRCGRASSRRASATAAVVT